MKTTTTNYLHLLVISIISLPFPPTPTTAHGQNITAVFAFGDSILDAGNNNHLPTLFLSDHPPYGLNFPGQNPSGRFSDGKLSTDFLISDLGIKQLLPAYLDPLISDQDLLTGASFASAGTGLDDLTAAETVVLSLKTQLRFFEEAKERMERNVGRMEMDRVVGNALFMVAAGSNDMIYNFYGLQSRRMSYSLSEYHDLLLGNLDGVVRRLHGSGARRMAVIGLPPIGCLPVQVSLATTTPGVHTIKRECVNQQNHDSQTYNTKLQALISKLQATLAPPCKVAYVDIYTPIMDMVMNPAQFGLEETLRGCCGTGAVEMGPLCNIYSPTCSNPSKYLFWDAAHPTQATYMLLAKQFQKKLLPSLLAS